MEIMISDEAIRVYTVFMIALMCLMEPGIISIYWRHGLNFQMQNHG